MYEKLNITENHFRALALFTKGFDNEYYIREVQKLLKISPRTAQLLLEQWEKKAVLESKVRGKIRTYKLKISSMTKNYLTLVEEYKKITFLQKRPLIQEVITKILPHITGIALVFGSYAKGTATKDSDIDIFIVGSYKRAEVKRISEMYNIEVNIKVYPMDIFEKELKSDFLVKEVLSNHVAISGVENFIEKVFGK